MVTLVPKWFVPQQRKMSGGKGSMGQFWSLGYLEPKLQWSLMETSNIGIWLDNQCHACQVWLSILGSTFQPQKSNLGHLQCGSGGCRSCKSLGGATALIWVDSWLLECLVHLDLAISTWCKCCELNLNKWVSYRSEKSKFWLGRLYLLLENLKHLQAFLQHPSL